MRFFRLSLIIFIVFGFALFVHAQTLPTTGDYFQDISPIPPPVSLISKGGTSPSPGDTFLIYADTPTSNPDTSSFQWTIDGKLQSAASGPGKTSIQVTAGPVGTRTKIDVTVISTDGKQNSDSLTIWPSDISLTWTAKTYTPPWYIGKALPSAHSDVVVTAVPYIVVDGKQLSSQLLKFRWSLDDQSDVRSGVGQNTFRIQTGNYLEQAARVTVIIEDLNNRVQAVKTVSITNMNPEVQVYQHSPLGGIEPRTSAFFFAPTGNQFLDAAAEPFYFPVTQKRNLSYAWTVSGSQVSVDQSTPYLLSIQTPYSGGANMLPVSVQVSTTKTLIPSTASRAFNLRLQ